MPDVDVIMDVLKQAQAANPASTFINSLLVQYQERGSLSKKQLEGLHSKALKTAGISPGKLATLEAIIKKKPTRERSAATITAPVPLQDEALGEMLSGILARYPQHKRVLFLHSKYQNHDHISAAEIAEIERFKKLLLK